MLTKAAVFKKPVVVSDGFLMAERVRVYRMGENVPEGDVSAFHSELLLIRCRKADAPRR